MACFNSANQLYCAAYYIMLFYLLFIATRFS
jgi:hypothetical protein